MDFAALMSKELSKSKKPSDEDRKYSKRSDIEAQRKASYLAEQEAAEAERQAKAAAKRKREDEIAAESAEREEKRQKLAEESRRRREDKEREETRARRKHLGLPELDEAVSAEVEDGLGDIEDVPEDELVEKLRALGEPVALFGEGHAARVKRYRKLTTVLSKGPIPTTLELVDGEDMKVDGTVPKDNDGKKWLFRQLASYFTMILTEYQQTMEAEKRDSTASKIAYNAMVQTRENMKPVRRTPTSHHAPFPLLTFIASSSASSKKAISTTLSSSPSWKSPRRCRSAATWTPTTAICASASARPPGPSASLWWASTSVAHARSFTTARRAT